MARRLITGGAKLRRWARKAVAVIEGNPTIEVGWFGTRYPSTYQGTKWRKPGSKQKRTPVAQVAAAHEYGLGNLPERPFFRRAIRTADPYLKHQIRRSIDVMEFNISAKAATFVGRQLANTVRQSIEDYRDPDGTDALVDSGLMKNSVDYRVIRGRGRS